MFQLQVANDHKRPVNVYSRDPNDGHSSAKTVNVAVGHQDPQISQKFILMINQTIALMA